MYSFFLNSAMAVSPADYTLLTTVLTFPAGSTAMQCIDIAITMDNQVEVDEVFTLNIDVTTLDVREGNTFSTVIITDRNAIDNLTSTYKTFNS